MIAQLRTVRSALFLPASNPRAIAKARVLRAGLVILDLEDAVREEDKADARSAAIEAALQGFDDSLVAIRVNGAATRHYGADCEAVRASAADCAILPMVDDADKITTFASAVGMPVLAMIETARGALAASAIAAAPGVAGLIAGTNDLCAETGICNAPGRAGLVTALQTMVLAARASGIAAFDGVYNRLDDAAGFEAEARQGAEWGFDGKALIHPGQIAPANRIFGPSAADIEDARALVAAAYGGAERFRGRMVESLHVEQAQRLLARAGAA